MWEGLTLIFSHIQANFLLLKFIQILKAIHFLQISSNLPRATLRQKYIFQSLFTFKWVWLTWLLTVVVCGSANSCWIFFTFSGDFILVKYNLYNLPIPNLIEKHKVSVHPKTVDSLVTKLSQKKWEQRLSLSWRISLSLSTGVFFLGPYCSNIVWSWQRTAVLTKLSLLHHI